MTWRLTVNAMTDWTAADYAPCPECMHATGCKASKCRQPEACRCVVLCATCSARIDYVVLRALLNGKQRELFA